MEPDRGRRRRGRKQYGKDGRKGEVVDLMAALKASLSQRGGKPAARGRRTRAA